MRSFRVVNKEPMEIFHSYPGERLWQIRDGMGLFPETPM